MLKTVVPTRVVIYMFSLMLAFLVGSFIFLEDVLHFFGMEFSVYNKKGITASGIVVEEIQKQDYDLVSDASLTKFVDNKVSFQDLAYVPEELTPISSEYVFDTKGNGKMRKKANDALQMLAKDFYDFFGVPLSVVSSYRSYTYQKGIKERGCPDNLCAKAGYSEHQTGLTVDIFSASNNQQWESDPRLASYYTWMKIFASKYGFHNTYQKGLDIDGYEIEPWHWRYLGIELAQYLDENDLTIAEYYYSQIKR